MAAFLDGVELDRSMSLRDQVYKLVRRAIVIGRLMPGTLVDEAEIAATLRVSRTPVREAVKKVSDEGLIEVRAQSGTFVNEISRKQVREAYVIRIALELESVRHAATSITKAGIQQLHDLVDAHEVMIRRARFDEAILCDDAFHRAIAEASDFSTLWKLVDMSKAQMDRCRMLALPTVGAGETTILQHRSITDALAAHDVETAERAIRTHLEQSLGNTLAVLDQLET